MDKFKQEVEEELVEHILPFWINLQDKQNGGFFGEVDYDLNINKEGDKGVVAATRFLWAFSAAYRVIKKKEYLEVASHMYDFLINRAIDKEYKGLYWLLDFRGAPVDTRKHIYTQSFGIYAFSEYYRVTKKAEALTLAKELYELIETKGFDEDINGYKEEFDRYWTEAPNEMLSENGVIADVTMNTHLHILEAYTNLYNVWPAEELKGRIENLIYIFYEKIFDHKTKFLKVFFDKKWGDIIELKSFGHDIEGSWLIDEALKVIGLEDDRVITMIKDIAYNIADYAIQEDGSLINEEEKNTMDYTRVWWVQAEAMVGFLNAYQRTGDHRFKDIVKGLWKYTKQNIIDKRVNGEWYWSIEADGMPTKRNVVEPWKASYHNARFCLEVIERHEKL